jgi:tetratricopeptide (TPR) repeat protein
MHPQQRERFGLNRCRVVWALMRARYQLARGRYCAALEVAERACSRLERLPDRHVRAARIQVQGVLARIHEALADHDTTERLLQDTLSLLTDPPDPNLAGAVVDTLTRLGNLARLRGHYQQAEEHLNRAS